MTTGVLITVFLVFIGNIFAVGFIYLLVLLGSLLKTFKKSVQVRERELNYLEKKDLESSSNTDMI